MNKLLSNFIIFISSLSSATGFFTSIVNMHHQSSNNTNNWGVRSRFYWCFYSTRLIKVLTCFGLNAIFVRTDLNMRLWNKKIGYVEKMDVVFLKPLIQFLCITKQQCVRTLPLCLRGINFPFLMTCPHATTQNVDCEEVN